MHGDEHKLDGIFMHIGDKVIPIEPMREVTINRPAEREIEVKDGDTLRLGNYGVTLTLKDVELNKDFAQRIFSTGDSFTVQGIGYKFPRGTRLPKKKRLRKKWKKKYGQEFEYKNVRFQ